MIEKVAEWNQRMDAWQRKGGTPRWLLYMNLLSMTKMLPALLLTVGILWAFGTYWPGEPSLMLEWVGVLAIWIWCINRIEGLYSRFQRRDEGDP